MSTSKSPVGKAAVHVPVKVGGPHVQNILLYKRALHPEVFPLKGRRALTHGAYEVDAWIMPLGHMIRFRHQDLCACELVVDQDDQLPKEGAITMAPCVGEREFEFAFEGSTVKYFSTLQTENLTETLYRSTLDELLEFAGESNALVHQWKDDRLGNCLSVLELQRYAKEVHAQGYHLIGQGGCVLRTQAIFEHR